MINYTVYPGLKSAKVPTLIEFICKYYNITQDQLKSRCRLKSIVNCKKALCYYIHEHLKISCGNIELNYYDILHIKRLNIRYHHMDFKNLLAVKDQEAVNLNQVITSFFKF